MSRERTYQLNIEWTGSLGQGTSHYTAYERAYTIAAQGKPVLKGSSDPAFRGDPGAYNPEELLLASLSACHMLWYLHLCADHGIIVLKYSDAPHGRMQESPEGGRFTEVLLRPSVCVADPGMKALADELHALANRLCFIANSVNFPVRHEPEAYTA